MPRQERFGINKCGRDARKRGEESGYGRFRDVLLYGDVNDAAVERIDELASACPNKLQSPYFFPGY